MRTPRRRIAAAALAACAACAALAARPAAAQAVVDPGLQVSVAVSNIPSFPTSMVFIGPDDILVLEKNTGRVRRAIGGAVQALVALDLNVSAFSERGLLGIALHPRFPHDPSVFIYATESDTVDNGIPLANRVYRYTWDGVALVDPVLVLELPVEPGPNHDGGVILFGPDDALYAVIGDLNRNGRLENYPDGAAPDDTAVILRVDEHGGARVDNPFRNAADPADPLNRYFAYGIRNSFGLTFDPLGGDLWQTENGPQSYDEINRFDAGANSGWEQIMGPDARDPQGVADLWLAPGAFYQDPLFSWASTVAPTSIVFAASRRMGCANEHVLFVGDNNCGQIYRFDLTADRKDLVLAGVLADRVADNGASRCTAEQGGILFGSGFGVITDIENGPDGALYVVSASNRAIYRIGPSPGALSDADGDLVDDACDCDPADAALFADPVEVPRLRIAFAAETHLSWSSQAATAGEGTAYAVATGTLSSLQGDGGFAAACELEGGLNDTAIVDPSTDPPAREGRWYLVRAANGCSAGTFGDGTQVPDARDALDGSVLPPCQR